MSVYFIRENVIPYSRIGGDWKSPPRGLKVLRTGWQPAGFSRLFVFGRGGYPPPKRMGRQLRKR